MKVELTFQWILSQRHDGRVVASDDFSNRWLELFTVAVFLVKPPRIQRFWTEKAFGAGKLLLMGIWQPLDYRSAPPFILLFLGVHPADIPVQIDQTDITRGSVAYTQ